MCMYLQVKMIQVKLPIEKIYILLFNICNNPRTNWVPFASSQEGRWNHGGQYSVSEILAQLSRTNYSLAELTTKPLPDGADPLHLEVYLSNEEFAEALGMSRDEFYSLQSWKQTELKKKANLF